MRAVGVMKNRVLYDQKAMAIYRLKDDREGLMRSTSCEGLLSVKGDSERRDEVGEKNKEDKRKPTRHRGKIRLLRLIHASYPYRPDKASREKAYHNQSKCPH